jgi:isovaleryl-CoA dehydrogenase
MANKNLDKRRPTRSTDAVTVNYDASDVCDFSEEQRLLREQMRLFASRDVQPLARTLDIEARFPVENWRRGAELGLLGMAAPTEYGGSALGLVEMVIVAEELAAVCVSTAVSLLHQADLVIKRLVHHGTSEQKERWLPALCDGSKVGCLAITEPEAGSDALSMRTTARRRGSDYVINGSKTFITNGPVADLALVYARIDGLDGGLGLFAVEDGTPGFEKGPSFSKMGWRGSPTGELFFRDCLIPGENLIGVEGEGRSILFFGLNSERIVMAAESAGLTRGALEASISHARTRHQFGRPIGEFQMIQQKLADMYAELQAVSALTYRGATLVDRGSVGDIRLLAASCKLLGAELSMRATTEAVQIHGGYGYVDAYPVERFMRDAKMMQIGGGTSEIMKTIIARQLLK